MTSILAQFHSVQYLNVPLHWRLFMVNLFDNLMVHIRFCLLDDISHISVIYDTVTIPQSQYTCVTIPVWVSLYLCQYYYSCVNVTICVSLYLHQCHCVSVTIHVSVSLYMWQCHYTWLMRVMNATRNDFNELTTPIATRCLCCSMCVHRAARHTRICRMLGR